MNGKRYLLDTNAITALALESNAILITADEELRKVATLDILWP